jgi:hypothetical protein
MTFAHYEREDTGYGVLLLEPRSGLAIGLHTNTGNNGAKFDEAQTGLDHPGFRTGNEPFPTRHWFSAIRTTSRWGFRHHL